MASAERVHKELNTEVSCNEIQPSAASLPSLLASAGVKSFAQHGAAINRALGILSARLRSGARRHQRARQAPARPSWGAARPRARQMEAHLLPWCPRMAKPPADTPGVIWPSRARAPPTPRLLRGGRGAKRRPARAASVRAPHHPNKNAPHATHAPHPPRPNAEHTRCPSSSTTRASTAPTARRLRRQALGDGRRAVRVGEPGRHGDLGPRRDVERRWPGLQLRGLRGADEEPRDRAARRARVRRPQIGSASTAARRRRPRRAGAAQAAAAPRARPDEDKVVEPTRCSS